MVSSSVSVGACVSSEVIMASGKIRLSFPVRIRAPANIEAVMQLTLWHACETDAVGIVGGHTALES